MLYPEPTKTTSKTKLQLYFCKYNKKKIHWDWPTASKAIQGRPGYIIHYKLNKYKEIRHYTGLLIIRTVADPRNSGFSTKSREIPKKTQNTAKSARIYFQIHVGKTYFILILAIRPVLFTPNVQIYLETSSLQQ